MRKKKRISPKVKDVLKLLAAGTILTTVVLFSGIAGIAVLFEKNEKEKWEEDKKEWEKFNIGRLKQVINRLEKQKIVEKLDNGIIKITDKGKTKYLKFQIEDIKLIPKHDGKWRIVIYDIQELKRWQRYLFRKLLRKMKFLKLQKSVYLTPFPCENEIEHLKQSFNIGKEVIIITTQKLENEEAYKKYFGI